METNYGLGFNPHLTKPNDKIVLSYDLLICSKQFTFNDFL